MKQLLLLLSFTFFVSAGKLPSSMDYFFSTYVCKGQVDYEAIKKNPAHLASAITQIQATAKTIQQADSERQIAFYINLYNLYTIQLIVDNMPLKSIRDITQPWDRKFIPLNGEKVSLNFIEHEIIRKKYDEPRIHFALVCASIGCPPLLNEPYTGAKLSEQMDAMAKEFLTDTTKNYVKGKKLYLSKIFEWYGGDFKNRYGSYEEYVKGVLGLDGKYSIRFNSYDWNLNKTNCQ